MVVVVVNDSYGDVLRVACLLRGWIDITVLFAKNNSPPDQEDGYIGQFTSKLNELKRVVDGVRCGWISWIRASVAAGLVQVGSGLVGFVAFEEPFSLWRIHTRTHTSLQ